MECFLCLAYIAFDQQQWQKAKDNFNQAYFVAKECSEKEIAEQCLCNAGIAMGNMAMEDQKQSMSNTFYQTHSGGFGAAAKGKILETLAQ